MLREERRLCSFLFYRVLILVVVLDLSCVLRLSLQALEMVQLHLLSPHSLVLFIAHHLLVVHFHAHIVGLSEVAVTVEVLLEFGKNRTRLNFASDIFTSSMFLQWG